MVCKSINIKPMKGIVWIVRCDVRRHEISIVDWNEMRRTENRIYVNNSSVGPAAPSKTGANHPHASGRIWPISNVIEPMNESAAIVVVMSPEREETADTSNIHTAHAFEFWVSNNEHTVITRALLPPSWRGTDVFTPHATSAAKITWGVKCWWCWAVYRKFPLVSWAL